MRSAWAISLGLALASCGGGAPSDSAVGDDSFTLTPEIENRAARASSLGLHLWVESKVNPNLRTLLLSDYVLLNETQLTGGALFRSVFGGSSSRDVLRYLDARIHYVIAEQDDSALVGKFAEMSQGGGRAQVIASNLSLPIWAYFASNSSYQGTFEFDGLRIPVQDSRVGIMMLGEGYRPSFHSIARMGVLVHEARHSDCPYGLPQEFLSTGDLKRLNRCGHTHVVCPSHHDFAGLPACDDQAWGAYSMGMIYYATLQASCADCSEDERLTATAQALDSASRLLLNVKGMLAGDQGQPNMAHNPQIIGPKY